MAGLRDMDGDGDLDLVIDISTDYSDMTVWIENTGYQHTNYAAADLNHDGKVDGADLGLLLVSWGQNQ